MRTYKTSTTIESNHPMSMITIVLLLLPIFLQPQPSRLAQDASVSVASKISSAVASARSYTPPAWVAAIREELADDETYATTIIEAINAAATETGLPEELIWSVMHTESHGRHFRRPGQVKRGGAGEVGVMQVLPWWERGLKKEYDIDVDLYDVTENIRAGAYILRRGGTETRVMLSYYNTGQRVYNTPYQRRVMRYLKQFETADLS